MKLWQFIIKRAVSALISLIGLTIIVFSLAERRFDIVGFRMVTTSKHSDAYCKVL